MSKLKSYCVVFIPNSYQHEDDPSDYKQWKDVEAYSSQEAFDEISEHASVVRVTEN